MPELPKFFDRRPLVWSFTLLHTYLDICPYQAAQRYIFKNVPFIKTKEMEWGNEVHSAFEHRVGGGKPLPTNMQQWECFATPFDGKGAVTEQQLGVTSEGHTTGFFDKNVWGRGKLDVTVINGTTAYLGDWKTGNSKYESPFELECQGVLLHAKNPHLTSIRGQYIWLKENRPGELYTIDTKVAWGKITTAMQQIGADRATGHFEKREGPLCRFCPCFDCEKNSNPEKP